MENENIQFWLGTEASMRNVLESQDETRGKLFAYEDEPELERHRLLSVAEGIATIAVHGSLTSSDSPWNQYFGVTSYNEIRNAIIEAVEDEDVTSILLDVDTPGGDAKGVDDLSTFIKDIDARYKSVTAHVSGRAFSAGYWIASSARAIYGPKMSEAGSIGVIMINVNELKAMKERGYEVTVFKGGKYKALGNPYETLTAKAKTIIQAKIDKMEGFFLDAVAENRGISRASVKSQVGEGLTFFASEAVANGLMDEVISFDELFSRLIKRSHTSSASRNILTEDTDMGKKVLTAEAVSAIAAGASPESVANLNEEVSATDDAENVQASETAENVVDNVEANDGESGESASADAKTPKETSASEDSKVQAKAESDLVAFLKDELKGLRTENASLSADNATLKASSDSASASEIALKEIVNEYVAGMSVGIGMSAMNLKNMETTVVLKQYKEVRTSFTSRFKIGNVAEVEEGETEASDSVSQLTAMEIASINSNKI